MKLVSVIKGDSRTSKAQVPRGASFDRFFYIHAWSLCKVLSDEITCSLISHRLEIYTMTKGEYKRIDQKNRLINRVVCKPLLKILNSAHVFLFTPFIKATFHLRISLRGQRATGKIQRNNYHHGSCWLF